MKSLILIFVVFFSLYSKATGLSSYTSLFKRKVFVDFETVVYDISIDMKNKTVYTDSTIIFNQKKDGFVIFDLKNPFIKAKLDNKMVKIKSFFILRAMTWAKRVARKTKKGRHTLQVKSELKNGVKFRNGVELGFWMRDLFGRKFLEQYLPTNFEFDQYKARLNINFINCDCDIDKYTLMANGEVESTEKGYAVEFPSFYNSSSFFIHLFKKKSYISNKSIFTRMDGKKIDFVVYSKKKSLTHKLKDKAIQSVRELEELYGTWPHDYLIVYGGQNSGNMEHAGVIQTSLGALDHELHHSYFSKAVMPENGNAGWMDEAIVTWRDRGYPEVKKPYFKKHNLSCHSIYRRSTDWDSYKKGGNFIGHLAFLFAEKGIDFKNVLREYFHEYKFQIVNTKIFRNFLENYYGESLLSKFQRYTCGGKHHSRI